MQGISCGNSFSSRKDWPPCQNMWHAECYTSLGQGIIKFPMVAMKDVAGNPWHKENEHQKQMLTAVKGAHLCIPFQCEVCWF